MPDNITKKILMAHLVGGDMTPGTEMAVAIDQTLLQDATGTMASLQFEELDRDRVGVPLAVQYVDHNMIQLDFKNPDDHRYLQSFDARYGIYYSRPGNGICHYVHVERFAKPGTDPHWRRQPHHYVGRGGHDRHRRGRAGRGRVHGRAALRV
jgi:aconitate hydratase